MVDKQSASPVVSGDPLTGNPVTQRPDAGDGSAYNRAHDLISRAMRLPEIERLKFLDHECENDIGLRHEVEWMVEALQHADDDFLEQGAVPEQTAPSGQISVPSPRDYRIVRPLGEGGMGQVYLAERTEGDFVQRVALKFLNPQALLNPTTVMRFRSERQILAQLNHRNIAHLVDGGTLPDGRPFLAMEFVEGTTVDQYCAAHQLPERAKLELFVKVCQAVAYAHSRLVIHRDLKPANILVGADGEPKLLDFGIARLLDSASTGDETRTEAAQRMMTLAYASPEQIRGEALSTATDVYSLGVVLYEMLAGVRPFVAPESSIALAHAICDGEPLAPSVAKRQRDAGLLPLSKDIDAIVMKAIRKQPEARYQSAQALADDLRNYLESRAVEARRGAFAYAAGKFIVRHRIAAGWLALLVVLSIAFMVDRQVQLQDTRAQREVAETEQRKAQRISDFMVSMFTAAQPESSGAHEPTVRETLTRGGRRVGEELDGDPQVQVALLVTIANTMQQLNDAAGAVPLLEEAIAIADAHPDLPAADGALARVVLSLIRQREGDKAAAVRFAADAVAVAGPPTAANAREATSALMRLAQAHAYAGENADAVRQRWEQARAARALQPDARQMSKLLVPYSRWLADSNYGEQALAVSTEAMALTDSLPADDVFRIEARRSYGGVLRRLGRIREAEPFVTEAYERDKQVAERTGSATSAANYTMSYTGFLMQMGQPARAVPLMRAALTALEAQEAPNREAQVRLRHNLAIGLQRSGDLDGADAVVDETLPIARRAFGEDSGYLDGLLTLRLQIASSRENHARVLELWQSLLPRLRDKQEARAWLTQAQSQVIVALVELGRAKEGEALARESLALSFELAAERSNSTEIRRTELAHALYAQGRNEEGDSELKSAYAWLLEAQGECGLDVTSVRDSWQSYTTRYAGVATPPAMPVPDCASR